MENLESENLEQNLNKRDYDKEPIAIKDYFAWIYSVSLFAICILVFAWYLPNKDYEIFTIFIRGLFAFILLAMVFADIFKLKIFYINADFKFVLSNQKIIETKNQNFSINLDEIYTICLTYSDTLIYKNGLLKFINLKKQYFLITHTNSIKDENLRI